MLVGVEVRVEVLVGVAVRVGVLVLVGVAVRVAVLVLVDVGVTGRWYVTTSSGSSVALGYSRLSNAIA